MTGKRLDEQEIRILLADHPIISPWNPDEMGHFLFFSAVLLLLVRPPLDNILLSRRISNGDKIWSHSYKRSNIFRATKCQICFFSDDFFKLDIFRRRTAKKHAVSIEGKQ